MLSKLEWSYEDEDEVIENPRQNMLTATVVVMMKSQIKNAEGRTKNGKNYLLVLG